MAYGELSKRTVKDTHPLPRPDDVQYQLAGSTVLTTLGLQNGYWHLPVSPTDQAMLDSVLTHSQPGTVPEPLHVHLILIDAPSAFQSLIDKLCCGLPFATVYLNDILIHSTTSKEYEEHLRLMFKDWQLQASAYVTRCLE